MTKGIIFNIQRYGIHDGPGIRTTVFFKGCPLKCLWCANPESQNPFPELAYNDSLCTGCGKCLEACQVDAITLRDKGVEINRKTCTNCELCVRTCDFGALKIYGKEMTVDDIMQEVTKDELFYRNSNGGITVSGGEPLLQPELLLALFKLCQARGIHTCLDTSGYCRSATLERVLEYTDLVLFDLKIMDPLIHRKWIGRGNIRIIQNARLIASRGVQMIIRFPVIPYFNDTEQNIREIAEFIVGLDNVINVEVLPYHRLGITKYKMLNRLYKLDDNIIPTTKDCQRTKELFQSYGLNCDILT